MKSTSLLSFLSGTTLLVAAPAAALANPVVEQTVEMPAVDDTVEIAVGGTFNASLDASGAGEASVPDLAGAGGAFDLEVGWRLTPNLSLGAYGMFEAYSPSADDADHTLLGLTAGLLAGWHFRPTTHIDPWVTLGTGFRGLRISDDDAEDVDFAGFEIARVQAGVDYRLSSGIAVGPVIGASASTFVAQKDEMTDGYDEIEDKAVNWTIIAGLRARFSPTR